ncbi:hypothetical protein [Xanthomonas arboricola]|uniref:hypothetical protein n=1 Tax=Xanthomonas arboricola TaxID=56448 RepID=UPI000A9129C7|nr:hypothetical protein [Xanthomonas arboricola]
MANADVPSDTVERIVIDDFDDLGYTSLRGHYTPSKIPLTHLCAMHMQAWRATW